jgi:hypothetical protein
LLHHHNLTNDSRDPASICTYLLVLLVHQILLWKRDRNRNSNVIAYMEAYSHLAVPGVFTLIAFLSFSSQYLFYHIEPEPLTKKETIIFNALIAALLICYARSVLTDPGHIPPDWAVNSDETTVTGAKPRWCRKCEAVKPPRAHHCKICKRFANVPFYRDKI